MNNKWDIRFLELARHIAQWSKDPSTKCGAVIVRKKFIVSVGFNGFARYTDDSPEYYADRDYKLENVIHAEENAIISARQDLTGTSMHTATAICSHCTAQVINAGITKVMIPCKEEDPLSNREDWNKSLELAQIQFDMAGIPLRIMDPTGFDPTILMGPLHPGRTIV